MSDICLVAMAAAGAVLLCGCASHERAGTSGGEREASGPPGPRPEPEGVEVREQPEGPKPEPEIPEPTHGLVGLRPLPRTEADNKSNHGGPWAGMPTFDKQQGQYPFVAENLDVVKGWLDGDFKTRRMFFEYYWGLSEKRDVLDPEKNLLIKTIRNWSRRAARSFTS